MSSFVRSPVVAKVAAALLIALGCMQQAHAADNQDDAPPTLDQILHAKPSSPDGTGIPALRYAAIRETAITYGAQAGLARRSFEIQKRLEKIATHYDGIYQFQALMMDGNVVPPVMKETDDVYDQSSEDMLRVVKKVYRIDQQPRFAYVPPTWRAYLMTGYEFDRDAVAMVSPQSAAEKEVWEKAVQEGYKLGMAQAEDILRENMARLMSDFKGMALYHRLLEQGLVTRPYVGSTRKGVVKAEDGSMHIGEVFLRITAVPEFVVDPSKWKAGKTGGATERLKRLATSSDGGQLLQEARATGLVKDQGR